MNTQIYLNGKFRNINPENAVKSMREVESFCASNGIQSIIKLQGGYYFINKDKQFEFIARGLSLISFSDIYNLQKRKN